MVVFPNCKINIGLRVLRKRPDGFHDLETIFLPVPVCDILEVQESGTTDTWTQTGIPVQGDAGDNLCNRALLLLRRHFPDLPPLRMHLHKAIPMGAGLGGGSSDGTHTLLAIARLLQLQIPETLLQEMALELGSDCPFFLLNKPCLAYGRGEILEPVNLNLKGYRLALIHPGIHVPTGWAFQQINPGVPAVSLKKAAVLPVSEWQHLVVNDFQEAVAGRWPVIGEIIAYCYRNGAEFAAMTGTGSTCYGLFRADRQMPDFAPFADCWIKLVDV